MPVHVFRRVGTNVWGPPVWTLLYRLAHCVDAADDADAALQAFQAALRTQIKVLPCGRCRGHATAYLTHTPVRRPAVAWVRGMHNAVRRRHMKPVWRPAQVQRFIASQLHVPWRDTLWQAWIPSLTVPHHMPPAAWQAHLRALQALFEQLQMSWPLDSAAIEDMTAPPQTEVVASDYTAPHATQVLLPPQSESLPGARGAAWAARCRGPDAVHAICKRMALEYTAATTHTAATLPDGTKALLVTAVALPVLTALVLGIWLLRRHCRMA